MIKILRFVMLFAVMAGAAPNAVFNNDIGVINNFNADSLKFGQISEMTSFTLSSMIVMANDTGTAGFKNDSIKFNYGYRIGWQVVNVLSKPDTMWSPLIRIGTISTLPADTAGKWLNNTTTFNSDSSTGVVVPVVGVMDTSNITGYLSSAMFFMVDQRAHFVQPWLKGLAGNRKQYYVRSKIQIVQANYLPTRQQ